MDSLASNELDSRLKVSMMLCASGGDNYGVHTVTDGEAISSRRGRVVVAKVGLDGHDRGVKVVARVLRDAGFEVVYLGLRQTPEGIASAALEEDVDLVGLSMHSGAHLTLVPAVLKEMRRLGLDIPVLVGGIVPERDVATLKSLGVSAVLPPGSSDEDVIGAVSAAVAGKA